MNRVQLCGLLCADPDISIHKSGAMRAQLLLETYSAWQGERGAWEYNEDLHHITVYRQELVLFLQEKISMGDQLFVQGILSYGDNDGTSKSKKRNVHIIVPRKQGLLFQVKDNQNLPIIQRSFSTFAWKNKILETSNENKPQKSIDEIE